MINENGDESNTIYEEHLHQKIHALRKKVGGLYKDLSGKSTHYSDCSTNNAPAYDPEACDCEG